MGTKASRERERERRKEWIRSRRASCSRSLEFRASSERSKNTYAVAGFSYRYALLLFYAPFLVAFASFALHNHVCLFPLTRPPFSSFFSVHFSRRRSIFLVATGEGELSTVLAAAVFDVSVLFFPSRLLLILPPASFAWSAVPSAFVRTVPCRGFSDCCGSFQSTNTSFVFGVCSAIPALLVSAWIAVVRSEGDRHLCPSIVSRVRGFTSWHTMGPSLIC